jgi:2-polyprenyl-3-methyl-5-hydroxy-6-metoxy-1,4-benzoquinol methylase
VIDFFGKVASQYYRLKDNTDKSLEVIRGKGLGVFLKKVGQYIRECTKPELKIVPGGHFEALLKKSYDADDFKRVNDPVKRMWIDYALSTVKRGERVRQLILHYSEIKGKRYLDIGCAYGGFPLAFARAGANVVGIDISPGLLEFSKLLSEDYGVEISVFQKSILNKDDVYSLGNFEIITANDIIEHVDCPNTAMINMVSILSPGGLLFMVIPNKFSASFIKSDGHFKLFGITVLPKWLADRYHNYFYPSHYHDVRYRSLNYYINTLKGLGVSCKVINSLSKNKDKSLKIIHNVFCEIRKQTETFDIDIPLDLERKIMIRVLRIADLFDREYGLYHKLKKIDYKKAVALADRLILNFGEDIWQILVRKGAE